MAVQLVVATWAAKAKPAVASEKAARDSAKTAEVAAVLLEMVEVVAALLARSRRKRPWWQCASYTRRSRTSPRRTAPRGG